MTLLNVTSALIRGLEAKWIHMHRSIIRTKWQGKWLIDEAGVRRNQTTGTFQTPDP